MTMNVEQFASHRGADTDTSRTTHFEQTGDLTVTLKRGEHPDMQHVGSHDGIVLIRLAIDGYDGVAVVELEPSHSLGNDNLAMAEAALAHSVAGQEGKTVAAYKRTAYFEQRRDKLMPAWARYVGGMENVVRLAIGQ